MVMSSVSRVLSAVALSLSFNSAIIAAPQAKQPARSTVKVDPAAFKIGECIAPAQLQARLNANQQKLVAVAANRADPDLGPEWVQANPRAVDFFDSIVMVSANETTGAGMYFLLRDPLINTQKSKQAYKPLTNPQQAEQRFLKGFCITPTAHLIDVKSFDIGVKEESRLTSSHHIAATKRSCGQEFGKSCLVGREYLRGLLSEGYRLAVEGRFVIAQSGQAGPLTQFHMLIHRDDKDVKLIPLNDKGAVFSQDVSNYEMHYQELHLPKI